MSKKFGWILIVLGGLIMAAVYLYDPVTRCGAGTILGPISGPVLGIGMLITVSGIVILSRQPDRNR